MTDQNAMQLSIFLPQEVFLGPEDIQSLQVPAASGSLGFLPQRLDCVVALTAGLLIYRDMAGKEHFVAIDQGILTKAGNQVSAAVRNAVAGTDLGELHLKITQQFRNLDEEEKKVRQVMSQLESGFIRNFEQLTQK